jgi:hypothetical protein
MTIGGEILQLSFGPAANSITSHLCNLQGLASTTGTSSEGDPIICDPYITHTVQNEVYVPRVLFVDAKNHFSPWPNHNEQKSMNMNSNANNTLCWNENVEIYCRHEQSNNINNHDTKNPFSFTNDIATITCNQLDPVQRNAFNKFQCIISSNNNGASSVFNNVHSRYHASKYKHVSSQFIYSKTIRADDNNERCMKWDDNEEDEEQENDEYYDEDYQQRKLIKEQQQWNQYETEVQNELNHAWDMFYGGPTSSSGQQKEEEEEEEQQQQQQQQNPLHYLSWLHYFMPPHPFHSCYAAPLPFDQIINNHSSNNNNNHHQQPIMYSHYCGRYPSSSSQNIIDGISDTWYNELSDKIRKWLEECDAIKGIQLTIDNDKSLFGGIASNVLEELNDECKSAGKFSVLVYDGDNFDSLQNNGDADNNANNNEYWRSERKVVNTFRSHLNNGLNLDGIEENSDLVLPLSLKQCWNSLNGGSNGNNYDGTLFEASAVGALALEGMTLSYRLLKGGGGSGSKSSSKVGIMTGYYQGSGHSSCDDDVFPTVDSLSFHEFISSLRPSNAHTMLELSTCMKNSNNIDLDNRLIQGTSIERRRLEEERERNRNNMYYRRSRGRDVSPGLWLEDSRNGGILNPLIPMEGKESNRSMHRHFAMSSSFRPSNHLSLSTSNNPLSTYTTIFMEGMGIQYRPQSSVSTNVNQSLSDLTCSHSYAAGTYWSSIFKGCGNNIQNVPVLTVLGNSTRVHSYLNLSAKNMSQALSRKYQGYLSRDCMAGIVPEREDCTDALEKCLSLKDTYEPPMMFDEDEGSYFDDNSD